jgi:hypothetical protein
MDKYKALRRKYADAGIEMYRLARLNKDDSDDEPAYSFSTAQVLGANQITVELRCRPLRRGRQPIADSLYPKTPWPDHVSPP